MKAQASLPEAETIKKTKTLNPELNHCCMHRSRPASAPSEAQSLRVSAFASGVLLGFGAKCFGAMGAGPRGRGVACARELLYVWNWALWGSMVIGMNRVFKFGASGIFPEVLFADSDGLCRPVGELPALPASPKPHSGLRRTFDAYVILCVGYCSVLTIQPCTLHALRIGNLKKGILEETVAYGASCV